MSAKSARPGQVAYLNYMGVPGASRMTEEEAAATIENLPEGLPERAWNDYHERSARWHRDKLMLHPEIFSGALRKYLGYELPQELHQHVRGRVTNAEAKLTKAKIKEVMAYLNEEDENWWHSDSYKHIFFKRLSAVYPACVSLGRTIDLRREEKSPPVSSSFRGPPQECWNCGGKLKKEREAKHSGSGCLLLVIGILLCFFPPLFLLGIPLILFAMHLGSKAEGVWRCKRCESKFPRKIKWYEFG